MSKIGRSPINFSSAKIGIDGNNVVIEGPNAKFTHELPVELKAVLEENVLKVMANNEVKTSKRTINDVWGLHRVLLFNKVQGAEKDFERKLIIVGLGYKAAISGNKMTLTLGYTHPVEYELPEGVTASVDKSGQNLTLKSADKFELGNACDAIKRFRRPEPYKGTGIMFEGEKIIRKAGKAKSA